MRNKSFVGVERALAEADALAPLLDDVEEIQRNNHEEGIRVATEDRHDLGPMPENKNPAGRIPGCGTACRGAGVCTPLQSAKLTHQSGKRFHFRRPGPTLATEDEPSQRSLKSCRQARPSTMAERAFHAIRAFRFHQGVQPIGLTSIRTPARELNQRPFFLWQGNRRRYGPKASLMQRQR